MVLIMKKAQDGIQKYAAQYVLILCIALPSFSLAKSPKEIETYPIIGSISTSVNWNHSNFVRAKQSEAAQNYDPGTSDGFGWSILNINNALSYTWRFSPTLPPLFFSGGVGFSRALSEGFNRAGIISNASTQAQRFYVRDMNLSMGWSIPKISQLIPRFNANIGLNASVPFSVQSRAFGIKSYLSSFLSLIYATPFKLVIQSTGFVGYNVLEQATQQIDCSLTPQACQISGEDLGSPNDLMYWGGAINLQYPILGGLRAGVTYRMFGSLLAVRFPDTETDPYASEYAQSGKQVGALIHGTSYFLIYGFNRTASAAQEALNKSLGVDEEDEESFLSRLSLSFSMTTNNRLYSSDGQRITLPIFDFETENRSRTTYTFSALITL